MIESSKVQPATGIVTEERAADPGARVQIRTELPRAERWSNGVEWSTLGWIALLHLGALAAPFVFTWKGLVVLLVMVWLTGGVGICLGYHRLFTHRSFVVARPLQWLIAWIGGMAGEGPVIRWVANHRLHHARSDAKGDPHTPREGFWWSHVFWVFPRETAEEKEALKRRWAADLLRDPVLRFIDATFILWHLATGVALFLAGWLVWDLRTGLSLLVWGLFLRIVIVLHGTWLVNSASHVWGYRTYETSDLSRNNWWVALFTFGEGWHNNHHAFPRMARHGHRWWEIDLTYGMIRVLEWLRLARRVVHHPPSRGASVGQEG